MSQPESLTSSFSAAAQRAISWPSTWPTLDIVRPSWNAN